MWRHAIHANAPICGGQCRYCGYKMYAWKTVKYTDDSRVCVTRCYITDGIKKKKGGDFIFLGGSEFTWMGLPSKVRMENTE